MTKIQHKARAKAKPIERADRKVARKTGKARASLPVRIIGQVSELADQPPLIALSAVTIAAGPVARKPRLLKTGIRMLASHWLASKAKSAVTARIDRTRPSSCSAGAATMPARTIAMPGERTASPRATPPARSRSPARSHATIQTRNPPLMRSRRARARRNSRVARII